MGAGAPPPAEVGIVTLKTESVTLQTELPGRTSASLASDLRPQVSGILKTRVFQEGARVKAGQVMYEIDPAQYRAAYEEAKANVASAKATLESAKLKDQRFTDLVKIEGVSKQEAEDAHASHQLAEAGVAQKLAALEVARINLDYTAIRAPITGRIGKSTVTPGALVTANQAQPLATIRALDPIYVDLTESSEERLRLRSALGTGKLQAGTTKVKLKLPDGSFYNQDGTLEFSEVAVDEATGTVTLRATFPNPDDTLLPGMYVRAVLDQAIDTTAILAPQQGITRDPKGNAVAMVVSAKGTVEPRTLEAERAIGDRWLVTSGLTDGDKLIIEGLNKIGPGMPVHANEVKPGAAPAGGAPAAGDKAAGDKDAKGAPPTAGEKPVAGTPSTPSAAGAPAADKPAAAAPAAAKPVSAAGAPSTPSAAGSGSGSAAPAKAQAASSGAAPAKGG